MWAPMYSQDQENLSFSVFGVFHRKHLSNNSTLSPRNLGEGTDQSPAGSVVAPFNNLGSKQILFHKPPASKWRSGAVAASSQPGNSSWGAKRGRKQSKKPQHYVVKPPSPERAERAGKSSLAALSRSEIPYGDVPSPGLAGNACRDTGAKELRRKRSRDAAGEAAQAPQHSRVTALRYVAAFWHSGAAKERVRKAKNAFLAFNSSFEPSICRTERFGKFSEW